VSAIWSNAAESSRSSTGALISPARAERSPLAIARVTEISRATGRVIRRERPRPVTSASSAARPAVPAIARSSAVRKIASAPPSPDAVRPTRTEPCRRPWTTTGTVVVGPVAVAEPPVPPTGRPPESRTCSCTPVRLARSRSESRSASAQLWFCCHAPPATAAYAWARLSRWWFASEDTSTAEKTAVRMANSATAASATARNASASRSPRVLPRWPPPAARGREASVIAGQAEPVAAAKHGHDDAGVPRVVLDLAAQVLHVRVDRPLVAFELVSPHLVDQLEAGVDPPGDRGERAENPPLRGRKLDRRAAHGHRSPRLVDDQVPAAVAGDALRRRGRPATAQDRLHPQHQFPRAERLGHVVVRAEFEPANPVLLGRLRCQDQDGNW